MAEACLVMPKQIINKFDIAFVDVILVTQFSD